MSLNTSELRKFAQTLRLHLLGQVQARLRHIQQQPDLVSAADFQTLQQALQQQGEQPLLAQVAYRWFNRLMALYYLDANGFQPLRCRVLTPVAGYVNPELLDLARQHQLPEALHPYLDVTQLYALLDGRLGAPNPENQAYRQLLTLACQQLQLLMPYLFGYLDKPTELLLPDDLTSPLSVPYLIRKELTDQDFQQPEVLGWLYQFYIADRKDEVFAAKGKVGAEDIPAATQIFTPRWIVEYLVQNTLGRTWLQAHPTSGLAQHMPYYLAPQQPEAPNPALQPQDLRLLDPACGSGHILVYAFELLCHIYEEHGHLPSEIPHLIFAHNLFGFEIDQRAAQLAAFALSTKARAYSSRYFSKLEKAPDKAYPQIMHFADLPLAPERQAELLAHLGHAPTKALLRDLSCMRQATNLGSLLLPQSETPERDALLRKLKPLQKDLFWGSAAQQLQQALQQLQLLGQTYSCVVANPPYMAGGKMNEELAGFVKKEYPLSKADLMTCFMESGLQMLQPGGRLGMINQHNWMFLGSFEALRKQLVQQVQFEDLLHLGTRTFPEIGGEVVQNAAFVLGKYSPAQAGTYIRLVDYGDTELKRQKTLEAIAQPDCPWRYQARQSSFQKMPGDPIAYWVSEQTIKVVEENSAMKDVCDAKQGLATADNARFLRYWWEVSTVNTELQASSREEAAASGKKWFPCNKGGSFRKWYGNQEYLVNWEKDGEEIRGFVDDKGKQRSRPQNTDYYFRESVSWAMVTSSTNTFRFYPKGFIFETAGGCAFTKADKGLALASIQQLLSTSNNVFFAYLTSVFNPTVNFKTGNFETLPAAFLPHEQIAPLVDELVGISKKDWDREETSWNFASPEWLPLAQQGQSLEAAFTALQADWAREVDRVQALETENNRLFNDRFGLSAELEAEVPRAEITLRVNPLHVYSASKSEEELLALQRTDMAKALLSYALGCLLGRYAPEAPGLLLASAGQPLAQYYAALGKAEGETLIAPDADGILPITEERWFADDLADRLKAFVETLFPHDAQALRTLEQLLGQPLRKYCSKDLYADHLKRYSNRPIYWLCASPKGHFQALFYLHRQHADTLNLLLNRYLRPHIANLRAALERNQHDQASATDRERARAQKEQLRLEAMLQDCLDYERTLLPIASDRLLLDLDAGVQQNYQALQDVLRKAKI